MLAAPTRTTRARMARSLRTAFNPSRISAKAEERRDGDAEGAKRMERSAAITATNETPLTAKHQPGPNRA